MASKNHDHERLNGRLDDMVAAAKVQQDDWAPTYQVARNYLYGTQNIDREFAKGGSELTINKIYPAVLQEVAILAQRRPKIVALPMELADEPHVAVWEKWLEYLFLEEFGMPLLMTRAALDAKEYGYYVANVYWNDKAWWDEKLHQWHGTPNVRLIKPTRFGADPEAETIKDASYVVCRRRERVSKLVRLFPGHRDEIEKAALTTAEDEENEFSYGFRSYEDQKDPGIPSNLGILPALMDGVRANELISANNEGGDNKPFYCTIETILFLDDSEGKVVLEERSQKDVLNDPSSGIHMEKDMFYYADGKAANHDNWPREEYTGSKYPYGRYILRVGDDTILNPKEADQRWMYEQWPYIVGLNQQLSHVWMGLNGVEQVRGLQDFSNENIQSLANTLKFYGNDSWLVEEGTLSAAEDNERAPEKLASIPGGVISVKPGKINAIKANERPRLDGSTMNMFQLVGDEMRDLTGVQAIGMGKETSNMTATEAAALDANSRMKPAMQSILMDDWTKRVMKLAAEMAADRMEDKDIIRVVGEKGAMQVQAMTQEMIDAKFDIKMEVTTALPFDKERRRLERIELFKMLMESFGPQAGLPLLPNILDLFDIEKKDEILEQITAAFETAETNKRVDAVRNGGAV